MIDLQHAMATLPTRTAEPLRPELSSVFNFALNLNEIVLKTTPSPCWKNCLFSLNLSLNSEDQIIGVSFVLFSPKIVNLKLSLAEMKKGIGTMPN